jgi:hypothetical protein
MTDEPHAVSRCRDCDHVQELCYSWCKDCGSLFLDIVVINQKEDRYGRSSTTDRGK